MVFKVEAVKEEASGFIKANTLRKPVTFFAKHKAKLVEGDATSHAINGLLARHGYTAVAGKKAGKHIQCLSALANCLKADQALTESIFPVVIDASAGGFIEERILMGFFYLEKYGNQTLTTKRWRDRIRKFTREDYATAIARAIAAFARGGPRRYAEGIMEVLNFKLRDGAKIEFRAKE